jgi:hypothetical protein
MIRINKVVRRWAWVKNPMAEKRALYSNPSLVYLNGIDPMARNQMTIGEEYDLRLDYSEV